MFSFTWSCSLVFNKSQQWHLQKVKSTSAAATLVNQQTWITLCTVASCGIPTASIIITNHSFSTTEVIKTCTLLGTNISPPKGTFEPMIFLFSFGGICFLVPWRVLFIKKKQKNQRICNTFLHLHLNQFISPWAPMGPPFLDYILASCHCNLPQLHKNLVEGDLKKNVKDENGQKWLHYPDTNTVDGQNLGSS